MSLFIKGLLLGGAITVLTYEIYYKLKSQKIKRIFAPKLEELMERATLKASIRRKELKRELTDCEKNKIVDECYKEI